MKHLIACFLVLFCTTGFVQAQNSVVIKGRVTDDSSHSGLSDVTVLHNASKRGTKTDASGNFTLTLPKEDNVVLTISSVGYITQTLTVKSANANKVEIHLKRDVKDAAEDVVVVGYQTMRRKDVLASVASVSAKDLKDIPINNAAEALNGRLAGVTATTTEGSPDAEIKVRVRGGGSITQDNSPLYIIDGVQVENGLQTLSPQDIQTIDVLKDAAAAAIYGARGANGVIIITTKSGKTGKPRLGYNGFVGVKNLAKSLDVLSPYDFVVWEYERSRASASDTSSFRNEYGPVYGPTWDTLAAYKNMPSVDWQKEMMGRTGLMQTHNVTFGGGDKKTTYNLSYTYNSDKAIVLNSDYIRHLVNLKADHKVSKNFKVGGSFRYNNTTVFGAGVSDERGSSYNRLRNAVKYRPFLMPDQTLDEGDPNLEADPGNGLALRNPILLANSEYRKKSTNAYNITLNASYTITKNLSFKSTFGYDYNNVIDRKFYDSVSSYSRMQGGNKPIVALDTVTRKTITNSNVLAYSLKGFKRKHDIDVMVGEETYEVRTQSQSRLVGTYPNKIDPNDAFSNLQLGIPFANYPKNRESRFTQLSFFGRVNYSFLKRYMFSFNMRADGSSKFAEGNNWGYFPAGSLAWKISQEPFMSKVNFINDLKLRVGYGTVGNNRINDYLYLTNFTPLSYYYGIGGQVVQGYTPVALTNERLLWETTVNRNIGLDATILRNRLDISIDYYDNYTKNLLLNVPIASTYGYATQIQNIGKTSSRGWEFQLNGTLIRKKNVSWTANFNISFNKNRVEALGIQESYFADPSWGVSGQPNDYIVKVGEPVGSMYGWVNDGFYNISDFDFDPATLRYTLKSGLADPYLVTGGAVPGGIKFKDLNGDGVVDFKDRTIIGNANPKFTGGFNQQLTLKNWDFSMFINFSYGNDIYNANKIEFTNGYTPNSNLLSEMSGRWRTIDGNGNVLQTSQNLSIGGGPIKTYAFSPSVDAYNQLATVNANATIWSPIRGSGAFFPHSWAIEDGSFIRINNVTVGYTLPVKTVAKLRMSKVRFYVTANNLLVISKYSGFDPEVSVRRNNGDPTIAGLDYSAYPKSRSFIFGINATF